MITETITVELYAVDFEFEVTFCPSLPARLCGLPEDCYPEEPAEIENAELICASIMEGWEELPLDYAKVLLEKYSDEIFDLLGDEIQKY
jgi:hypothetical protein